VLLPALLEHFRWSHTKGAWLLTTLVWSAGLAGPLVGWLLDRIEARFVLAAGALAAGIGFLGASQSNSFGAMLGCYALVGIGIAAGTVTPVSFVVANCFEPNRRGLPMGVAIAGTSVGGALVALAATCIIRFSGLRTAYVALAIPMLLVVIPLVLIMVRSRSPRSVQASVAKSAEGLPGLGIAEAVKTRSFWMIVAAQFCFGFTGSGVSAHLVAYLEGIGYASAIAALALSLVYGFTSVGKVLMGVFADRTSARIALMANFSVRMTGLFLALGAHSPAIAGMFVVVFGLTLAAPLMLIPLVTVESLGLRRYGSIAGITSLALTFGAGLGALAAGRIFDVTASYAAAFEFFIVIDAIGALASYACLPLSAEQVRLTTRTAASASSLRSHA
jgi:MFS family permease